MFRVGRSARLLIVGQAPGRLVHETGIPWNDPSGDVLRGWLQLDRAAFYDTGPPRGYLGALAQAVSSSR